MTLQLMAAVAVDIVPVMLLAWVTWQAAENRSPPNATAFAAVAGGLLFWAVLSLISEFPHEWSVVGNLAGVLDPVDGEQGKLVPPPSDDADERHDVRTNEGERSGGTERTVGGQPHVRERRVSGGLV